MILQALGLAVLMARTGLAPPAAKPVQLPPFSEVPGPYMTFLCVERGYALAAQIAVHRRQVASRHSIQQLADLGGIRATCHGMHTRNLLLVA